MSKKAFAMTSDYYDGFPVNKHSPGDIWINLPSFGLWSEERIRGIVITPACDLAHRKTNVITYLPVVPVASIFISNLFFQELKDAVDGQLEAASIQKKEERGGALNSTSVAWVAKYKQLAEKKVSGNKVGKKEKDAAERALAGLDVLYCILSGEKAPARSTIERCQKLLGEKKFRTVVDKVIGNGFSDMYFLPKDGQQEDLAAVYEHSVALFRYPISVPMELLDMSLDLSISDWGGAVASVSGCIPQANFFNERPMKVAIVKNPFLLDLLTKFAVLYMRLGSPDFSKVTADRYAQEV